MEIQDDYKLLSAMGRLSESFKGSPFAAGPYWAKKAQVAARQIRSFGLSDFRGSTNAIGRSFSDAVPLEAAVSSVSRKEQVLACASRKRPLSNLVTAQVALTRGFWDRGNRFRQALWEQSARPGDLVGHYTIPDTLSGGCIDIVDIRSERISSHYLLQLDTHDQIASRLDHSQFSSMLEIGGGFGSYVHLLESNYPRLRKYIYVDIYPNLYVGTQYLRAFYGDAVRTVQETAQEPSIQFRQDSSLEIFPILPEQLARVSATVDWMHNAHSFVEMPSAVVANYAAATSRVLAQDGAVSLATYSQPGSETLDPESLPSHFDLDLEHWQAETLVPGEINHYFVHGGDFRSDSHS